MLSSSSIEHHAMKRTGTSKDEKKLMATVCFLSFVRLLVPFSYEYVQSGLIGSNRLNSGYGHRGIEHALHDAARRQVYHVVRRVPFSVATSLEYSSFSIDSFKIYTKSQCS